MKKLLMVLAMAGVGMSAATSAMAGPGNSPPVGCEYPPVITLAEWDGEGGIDLGWYQSGQCNANKFSIEFKVEAYDTALLETDAACGDGSLYYRESFTEEFDGPLYGDLAAPQTATITPEPPANIMFCPDDNGQVKIKSLWTYEKGKKERQNNAWSDWYPVAD